MLSTDPAPARASDKKSQHWRNPPHNGSRDLTRASVSEYHDTKRGSRLSPNRGETPGAEHRQIHRSPKTARGSRIECVTSTLPALAQRGRSSASARAAELTDQEWGRIGGRTRWDRDAIARGLPPGPRHVRLDTLPASVQAIIRAILAAQEAASAADKV
jgi:hypothetical protein